LYNCSFLSFNNSNTIKFNRHDHRQIILMKIRSINLIYEGWVTSYPNLPIFFVL
jgi:hypothetical protein